MRPFFLKTFFYSLQKSTFATLKRDGKSRNINNNYN
jgi:hypothetical protein